MTGVLAAVALSAAGVNVCVLEAATVGRGSTAASSALLLQEPDYGMRELARRYGAATSVRMWQLSRSAGRDFITLMRRLRIACDLEMRPAIYYASDSEAEQRLRAEFKMRTSAGFDAKWLGPRALRETTGIAGRAAIRTSGNAQFDPWKACCGLVRTAVTNGARVFERSRVTRIVQTGTGVRLHTKSGRIDAARVVIATGYATPYFRPLAGKFRLFHTYVLATEPLSERQRREVGLSRVMTWDTARPYHYSRWTADHRLLLGGGDRPVRSGQRRDYRRARDLQDVRHHFERLWPALSDVHISSAWEGLFATTPDSLPYIGPHARYPNHLFALGYGGNGMTFSFLAARMLVEQWHGEESPDHRLFRFARVR